MFRNVARLNQQLPNWECVEILKKELRGVLSVIGDNDYPYGIPMNHYYNEEDGKIYFHSGKTGHKIDALKRKGKASFCVYDSGIKSADSWWLNFRSVVVFGYVEFVEDRKKIYEICRRLSRKFTQDEEYIEDEINRAGPRTLMFALVPEHITGKAVRES